MSALLGATTSFPVHYALAQDGTTKSAGDPLFTSAHGEITVTAPKPRVITIPDVGNYKVLKGDFHMHTLFSDGVVMPKVRVQEAIENGLDCIAITDHIEVRPNLGGNSIKLAENNDDHSIAYNIAKPEADKGNLILIRGTEITKKTMPPGHFNAIFIKDANAIAAVVDDWKKMLAVAADQGGFVFWNHPGWVAPNSGGLATGVPMSFTDEHEDVRKKGHLHGVEVFNGTSHFPIVSDWCNERNLGLVTVSDIHSTEYQMYGVQNLRRPMTLILAEDRTESAIREAFFAHRTIGWAADMIFGKPEWVEKLFRSSVEIEKSTNGLTLRNISDIPCLVGSSELASKGTLEIATAQKLTVNNWFVGTNKPLEIAVQ